MDIERLGPLLRPFADHHRRPYEGMNGTPGCNALGRLHVMRASVRDAQLVLEGYALACEEFERTIVQPLMREQTAFDRLQREKMARTGQTPLGDACG